MKSGYPAIVAVLVGALLAPVPMRAETMAFAKTVARSVRITGITDSAGNRHLRSLGATTLSGTVLVHAVVPPVSRNGGNDGLGTMAILSTSDAWEKSIAAHVSEKGTVTFVLDTAQLENGICDISVRDLRGHTDTRRVRIDNPVGDTGFFSSRAGLPMQSRSVPELKLPSGEIPHHAMGYETFLPAICSEDDHFQIDFVPKGPEPTVLEIRDRQYRRVRTLAVDTKDMADEREQRQGKHRWYASIDWNGRNDKGQTVPNGEYQVLVALPRRPQGTYQALGFIHKATGKDRRKVPPTGDTPTPGLRFLDLSDRQALSGNSLVSVIPAALSGHVLLLLDGEPVAAAEAEVLPPSGGARLRNWVTLPLDTVRYANGAHVLEACDFHGHSARRTVVFRNRVSEVIYEPDFDRSTPDSTKNASCVTATLPRKQPWVVAIVDAKGRTVRTFRGGSRTVLLAWDGNDDKGGRAPDGRYEIRLRHGTGRNAMWDTIGYTSMYYSGE